jgi:hypothetical protein
MSIDTNTRMRIEAIAHSDVKRPWLAYSKDSGPAASAEVKALCQSLTAGAWNEIQQRLADSS